MFVWCESDDIEIELLNRGSRNIFKNKWKVISDDLIDINLEKNYNVAVPKGSSITVDGIKVDKKYLLKDNNKYKGLDLYELPVILSGTHKLSLVINKEIVTKKIDTEKLIKLNDIIQITKDDLSDESIEELNKRVEESLTSIMNDLTQTEQIVITNDYSKYVDEKHLQEIFEDKREDLLKDNKELTNFKITNTLLSNVSVDKKGIVLRYLFTYEYEIKEDDNGTLTATIVADTGYDIALNGNGEKVKTISNIIADTVNPVTNWQSWVESEAYGIKDNGNGTWTVTFSETMYVYNDNTHKVGNALSNSNKSSAPIL